MAEHRKHHFVPEFLLRGFLCDEGNGLLHVLDMATGKQWRSRPEELAHQRDLYRIQHPGADPNVFEKAFGAHEGQIAEIIRRLDVDGVAPEREDLSNLLFFVAILAVRVPSFRAQVSDFVSRTMRAVMQMELATPERWEKARARMRADGVTGPAEWDYEEAKAALTSDYSVDYDQTWHVGTLYDSAKAIMPHLEGRGWVFVCAEEDAGDFICSDRPVALTWRSGLKGFWPPGFAVPNTEVTLPLTRRWAMVGGFERESGVATATRKTVAQVNRRTGLHARRLYSAEAEFFCALPRLPVGTTADLLRELARRKPKPVA